MTACRAEPGGFNLLPYRERLAQALRRRRAAQCGAAILFGALGVGLWAGVVTGARWRVDAERESVEARLRQLQPQVGAATRRRPRLPRLIGTSQGCWPHWRRCATAPSGSTRCARRPPAP
jgi:hypothetical protein